MNDRRVGVWLIGACGSVSSCVVSGVEALKAGLISRTGLVSELREIGDLGLVPLENLVFGGYEVRSADLVAAAEEFGRQNGVLTREILEAAHEGLVRATANVKPGITLNCGEGVRRLAPLAPERDRLPIQEIVETVKRDLGEFRTKNRLDEVIVVNVASTEPHFDMPREYAYLETFLASAAADRREMFPASVLYAYAAIDAGFPYVNFTASPGSSCTALDELARKRGVPHCGRDAKTGETLVKTTLAPMFVARNLQVLTWEGHNILGNRDGLVLDSPAHNKAKCQDKDKALRQLLEDDSVHTRVRIDYVPSLGDWKTAWDFIHFEGFLGARMKMQFIWEGCDSALAAPLVLDLVRFADFAHRSRESGVLRHLACFFKAPYGVEEHSLATQMEMLFDYARDHRLRDRKPVRRPASGV